MTSRFTAACLAASFFLIGSLASGCADQKSKDSVPKSATTSQAAEDPVFGTKEASFSYAQAAAATSDVVVVAKVKKPVGSYSADGVEVSFVELKVRRSSAKSVVAPRKKIALAVPEGSDFKLAQGNQILVFGVLRENVPGVTAVDQFLVANGGESGVFQVSGGRATAVAESMTGLISPGDGRLSAAVTDLWDLVKAKDL